MGTYGKAGLAQGLSSGLMGMGSMLLDVQARQEQRAFREYQVKATAQERRDRLDDMEAERKSRDAATFRVAQAAEMAERKRQDEAIQRATMEAQDTVTKLQAEGRTGARIVPREGVSGWMGQMPTIDYGPQPSFEETPEGRKAKYFTSQGFSPTGARITSPEPPPAPSLTMEGRKFPDTPAGQAAALEWKKQVGGGAGGGLPALPGGLVPGGGEETAPEGPGFFRRMGNRLGLTEPAAPAPTASTPARAFAGEAPAFAGPQLPAAPVAGAAPSGLEQDIEAALADGDTPETILSDMEAAGVPQEMMIKAAEILRNRAR